MFVWQGKAAVMTIRGAVMLARFLLSGLGCLVSPAALADKPAVLRDWTPADSVAVRYFSDARFGLSGWPSLRPSREDSPRSFEYIYASPDGEYFYFVSHHGVLNRDSNVYELAVYS